VDLKHLASPTILAACWRFYRRTEQAELGLISAGVAFFAFLAVFPAAAAIITIWGLAFDPQAIRDQMILIEDLLPPDAAQLLRAQVEALLTTTSGTLGWATLLSTLFALWSARAGVAAIIRGLNAIHHLPNRAGHWHQLSAIALTLSVVVLALAAMLMTVVLPLLIRFLPQSMEDMIHMPIASEVMGLALVVLATGLAYRYGPNLPPTRRPPLFSLGLVVAVMIWGLSTLGFTLYLEWVPSFNQIYGSIGAVVALLMWFYVSAYAVLLGAAIDAERARSRRQ
jgi:membrane protein